MSKILIIACLVFSFACTYEKENEKYPPIAYLPNDSTLIDSTRVVSYHADVQPIIVEYCVNCHARNGEAAHYPLTTYSQVKAGTELNLLDRIRSNDSTEVMPPGMKLSAGKIHTIELWKAQGYLQ